MERTKLSPTDYGIDRLLTSIKIASLCHHIFRSKIMKETIGIIQENEKNNIRIQHSKNGGEIQMGKYRLDGCDQCTNTYYEFHGCLFHGCPKCFKSDTFNSFKQELMGTTYEKYLKRIRQIKKMINDANLIEIWECDRDKRVKNDAELGIYVKQFKIHEPINPRDALFGGRTKKKCLEGTRVTLEVQEALRQGYQKVEIYEVWNREKMGLLFGDYVDMFLKGKQEVDEYPGHAKTDEEKEKYIRNYFKREGFQLDADKIQKKQRFGMNTNITQYKVISDPLEWFEIVSDDQFNIHNADFSHENYVQVFYSTNVEMHSGSLQTSVVLAAFVTCLARLKIYEELKKIDRRVLCFDKDSIIYVKGASHRAEFISAGPKNYENKGLMEKQVVHLKALLFIIFQA
ncbi:unnamed protein product [Brachionus calyciflorus]|uniref:DNA-directed DNA polymerase n=1 Tax=Brachionus calyciflorus TaxID=104777 RepID=A0A814DQT9_9BILA|nr:unnamed protein product [Brachionus calyciflorus]